MRGMISAQTARRAVWRPLWELPRRADLIWPLARRMTLARYRGSALGMLWALLTPAVMIGVFTFIFAGIFGARFTEGGTPWEYALYLFCGLLPWTAFSETLLASAGIVVAHANVVIRHELHATALWLFVLLVPQLLFTLGGAWLVASLGVFVRDTSQVLGLLLMAWMYLTPIIYPE